MRRILATLFAATLFATSALAQSPPVPLGPSGGGGGGGGGGFTIGGTITGTCPNGDVVFSSSGTIGCEVVGGTGTVTSVGWTGGIVSIANPTTVPAFTIAGTSGGIPCFTSTTTWASSALLASGSLLTGGGAGVCPASNTTGTGVLTALGVNTGSAGAFVVNGGALGTPSGGTLTNATGLPAATGIANGALPSGVTINNANWSGTALSNANLANPATTVNGATCALGSTCAPASPAVPLTVGTSGSITGSNGYYVCTGTCSIALPTPAAGDQFCIRDDSAVTTVITISAISSVQFEKTTYNGYGTVTTGTMISGGALGDKICLIGRDATHYLVGSFVGTWTNS